MDFAAQMRSILLVRADSPARLRLAATSGANAIALSLTEVRNRDLPNGREMVKWVLFRRSEMADDLPILVQVHDWETEEFERDIATCLQHRPDGIIMSHIGKARTISEIDRYLTAAGISSECAIVPILDNNECLCASEFIDASPRVAAIARDEHVSAVSQRALISAAHRAGVAVIDSPLIGHRNAFKLIEQVRLSMEMGFDAKFVLRNKEVAFLNSPFSVLMVHH